MKLRLLIISLLLSTSALMITSSVTAATGSYSIPAGLTTSDYMARTIIFRVKPEFRSLCSENQIVSTPINKILAGLGQTQLFKVFPNHQPPATPLNERGQKLVDLSLIYELHYSANLDLVKVINSLLSTGVMMYAEVKFLPTVEYVPSDPSASSQYHLSKIDAYTAWDIHKGDTNTIIGIVDTGTDLDHPDLVANLKINYADPVNGIDDDSDGYIDNFQGWDLGESDNTPETNANNHGSHVAGCAAAVTDNAIGVAAPGFYCKYLPVKIADATGALTKAYEGIVYAADHGCQVINNSWGGEGGSSFGQNTVDYATFNKNSLVVCAAGNNSSTASFYPAAYNNVLSIAATTSSDGKAWFSNYGAYIDVCAPGNNIFATQSNDTYASQSGTSMAAPVAAGCAAVVKSYFPTFTATQVGEQLRVTADNIYGISVNAGLINMLGTGRINFLNALTLTGPSVRMSNRVITDNNDDIFVVNDSMFITADFTNYLDPTTNLLATLTVTSPYVTIVDGSTTLGAIPTLGITNNNTDPFVVKINSNAPQNTLVTFKVTYQDGLYNDFEIFQVIINVDYLNITINDVLTTNSSKGRISYNGTGQSEGLGFNYNSQGTITYETGLMIGTSNSVADNVRGASGTDDDFLSVSTIQKFEPGLWSDFDTYGKFNDNSNTNPLGLLVDYRSMSWSSTPFTKFHIFEYTIHNNGSSTMNNLYAGIFSDWDIQTFANNKGDEDVALKMGYVYCTDANGLFGGTKVLTPGAFIHNAIDNITGGAGGLDLSNGFDTNEKYLSLSTQRSTAGGAGTGNDVIDVVSTGPFTLAPGDSTVVAFALIAGDELNDLTASATQAQIKYDLVTALNENNPSGIYTTNAYPNPSNGFITIPLYLQAAGSLSIEIYDSMGKLISSVALGNRNAGEQQVQMDLSTLSTGLYHYRLFNEKGSVGGAIQKN
ncbi:MAG: S8 family peptidase [Bacteroidetes bacterium]|nr:S8 family peptidase [Bacteroidota bacterium]